MRPRKKQNEQNIKLNYQNNQYWKAKLEKKKATKTLELAWVNPSSPRHEIKIT
jgi:hypothetical protein